MAVTVLVCDDHAVFRRGLAMVLGHEDDLELVGEAHDTDSALEAARETVPDVILMDLRMPGGGGVEATRRIKAELPDTRVIILTVSDDDEDLFESVKAGAVGYLLKEVSIDEVGAAVRAAGQGESLLSPAMTAKLLAGYSNLARQNPSERVEPTSPLTDRERQALGGIARGLSNRAIALELGIAENTVKNHVRAVLEKLGVSSRTEAALLAVRQGQAER